MNDVLIFFGDTASYFIVEIMERDKRKWSCICHQLLLNSIRNF